MSQRSVAGALRERLASGYTGSRALTAASRLRLDTRVLHIGILAHSADGSALCYLEMVRHGARLLGAHEHPEITLSIQPMGPVLEAYRRQDLAAVRAHLAASAKRLVNAGCDFFACPDNTAHVALETPGPPLPLPGPRCS